MVTTYRHNFGREICLSVFLFCLVGLAGIVQSGCGGGSASNITAPAIGGPGGTITVSFVDKKTVLPDEQSAVHLIPLVLSTGGGGLPSDVTVMIQKVGGNASEGVDFAPLGSGTITFPSGSLHGSIRHLSLTVFQDALIEGTETALLIISNTTGGGRVGTNWLHTVALTDDDIATVEFQATGSQTVDEKTQIHQVPVKLSVTSNPPGASLATDLGVPCISSGGTATEGSDYGIVRSSITFQAGASDGATASVSVPIIDDNDVEGPESIELTLFHPFPIGSVGNQSTHTVTITDDEGPLSWTQITGTNPWAGRSRYQLVQFNNALYLMGGRYGSGRADLKNDVWKSTDGITWTQMTASAAWKPQIGIQTVVFNNKMWVMGGWNNTATYRSNVYSTNDGANWTYETSAPWQGRANFKALVFNNKIYVMGGGKGLTAPDVFEDVWSSVDGINWIEETRAAPWNKRYGFDVVAYKNKMWLFGGFGITGYNNDVWSSTDGANWTLELSSAPWSKRLAHRTAVHNGKIYLTGGFKASGPKNDVWTSVDGVNWVQETPNAPWPSREYHQVVSFNGNLWIVGGNNGQNYYNDVWAGP